MTPATKKAADLYGRYFAFWMTALLLALVFWFFLVAVILPWERELTPLEQLVGFVGALAPMPLSALAFLFFRRRIRRNLGYADD